MGFQIVGDAEFRAEEGARQFRPQLLAGIRRRVPLPGERPVQAGGMAGPMTQLVESHAEEGGGVPKPRARRQRDGVLKRVIIGAGTGMDEARAAAPQQALQPLLRVPDVIGQPRHRPVHGLQGRDALDLRRMEYRVSAQQRNRPP